MQSDFQMVDILSKVSDEGYLTNLFHSLKRKKKMVLKLLNTFRWINIIIIVFTDYNNNNVVAKIWREINQLII